MTILATRTVTYDGYRNCTMVLTGVCDGNGGDEVNERKVILADLSPPPLRVAIMEMEYEVSGGIVRMMWEDNDPTTIFMLASRNTMNFVRSGGVVNTVQGDSITGNITFTTLGFDVGSSYTIKLRLKKTYQPYVGAGVGSLQAVAY